MSKAGARRTSNPLQRQGRRSRDRSPRAICRAGLARCSEPKSIVRRMRRSHQPKSESISAIRAAAAPASPIALEGDSFDVSRGARIDSDSRRHRARTDSCGDRICSKSSARSFRRASRRRIRASIGPTRRARTMARHARLQAPRIHLGHHDLGLQLPRPPRIASSPRPRIHPVDGAARHQRVLLHPPRARHATQDRRGRAALREHGIGVEYGGHVLQLLLPRERFAEHPEYFPAGEDGVRIARGNLCVSNPDAVALVCGARSPTCANIPKTSCCTSGAPTCGAARGADAVNAASCRRRFST